MFHVEHHRKEKDMNEYKIRPVTFKEWGVYKMVGNNRANVVFEGTYEECENYIDQTRHEEYMEEAETVLRG